MLIVAPAVGQVDELQATKVMRSGNGRFRADDLPVGSTVWKMSRREDCQSEGGVAVMVQSRWG